MSQLPNVKRLKTDFLENCRDAIDDLLTAKGLPAARGVSLQITMLCDSDHGYSSSDSDFSYKWKWGHVFFHNLCEGVRHEYFPPFPTPYCNVHTSYLYLLGKYCYCKLLSSRGSIIVTIIIYGYSLYYELPLFFFVQNLFHSFSELDFWTRQTCQ